MKSPNEVLKMIQESGETVKSFAEKLGLEERDVFLAIGGKADYEKRARIAAALGVSSFELFGK